MTQDKPGRGGDFTAAFFSTFPESHHVKTSCFFKVFFLCLHLDVVCSIANATGVPNQPGYVTSQVCAGCHQPQFEAWSSSHHSWAWREPARNNVLGDFDNARFEHAGFNYRFETDDDAYFIVADSPDGDSTRYPVRYVVGVTPLQQYLVETEPGRLQAMDLAWDTERKRWYHLYPDEDTSVGNGMHWSGSYKNWNARCAECHATDYKKNYNPLKDAYDSRQAEIGVGCEACHGPGEAHVAWARQPETFNRGQWTDADSQGLLATYRKGDASSQLNLCAGCHSRREPLGGGSPPPGEPFDDHYRLALLRDVLYFPDGQIRDEVYVYGSFLQSRMYAAGVQCTNCHDAHSYRLKAEGNALCTRCHNPQGNPAFPSLKKADYDTAKHHFHKQGSEGAACRNCHMPERNYMVVDGRRDHSFRVPRPDLSVKLGNPDSCTQCHRDKIPAWAAGELRQRFPRGRSGESHFGELFAALDNTPDSETVQQLIDLAKDRKKPAIVRASAVQRLAPMADAGLAEELSLLLDDRSAWVRAAAIALQRQLPRQRRIKALAPLLNDPMQSVRIEAAKASLDIPQGDVPENVRTSLQKAMGEMQLSLLAKADFPESQLVIGGVALTLRNLPAASSAFQRAVEMDPQLVQAWLMLARIQAVQGDHISIGHTLKAAIQANPDSIELKQALDEWDGIQHNMRQGE